MAQLERATPGQCPFLRIVLSRFAASCYKSHSEEMRIFLSAVSGQFKQERDALASDLRAVGAEVVVQEDFQQQGGTLLEKLEQYIATCDRVIALVGAGYGWEPHPVAVSSTQRSKGCRMSRLGGHESPLVRRDANFSRSFSTV